MTEKRFRYYEEENGEFPFPYIKDSDGKDIISLYQCYECLNALHEENQELIDALNQRTQQLDDCQQKVKETLQSFIEATKTMKQMKGANKLVLDSYIDLIKHIADELGVDLE